MGLVDLVWVRIFFSTSGDRIFFRDIQQCKILFPTLHAHYIFSVGIFFLPGIPCNIFLPHNQSAGYFSLKSPIPSLKSQMVDPQP